MSRTLSVHQEHELLLALEKAGLVQDEAQAVINSRKNQLAQGMIDWLRKQLTQSIFSTPQEILGHFAFYAGLEGWPVTDLLDQLHQTMPTDHVSSLDHLLTLDIWLGDLPTTFEALAVWIEYQQRQAGNGFWRWDSAKSDPEHLRLINPKRYGKTPSVKWVELDLLVNRGSSPEEVRDQSSAGLQVMTAFAVHPAFPPAIDLKTIPGAWAVGLQANIPDHDAWTYVPIFSWSGLHRRVSLSASWSGIHDDYHGVPVVREL